MLFMNQTKTFKPLNPKWYLIDCNNLIVGRLSCFVACLLRGKNKSNFAPFWNLGDHVILINSQKVIFSKDKEIKKKYYHHSLYPGGLKVKTAQELRSKFPNRIIQFAVKGMMPKNKLSAKQLKNLHIFSDDVHTFKAQKPLKLNLDFKLTNPIVSVQNEK